MLIFLLNGRINTMCHSYIQQNTIDIPILMLLFTDFRFVITFFHIRGEQAKTEEWV